MSQYNTGTEQQHASCLPPEAYIQMWRTTAREGPPPKFMSTVYPSKKPVEMIKTPSKRAK
jgi:hypothetical protein